MKNEGIKISIISIIVNLLLSIGKFVAGVIGRSDAMISDAIHTISDVLSTFVVIIGLKIANKSNDKDHQYGHDRFENVASNILSILLILVGIGIGINGIKNIINYNDIVIPNAIGLIAAVISIVTKELMYRYTFNVAKKLKSSSLKADAYHHRSDALSSVASLIGIAGAMLGFKSLDSIACIIICIFIIKSGIDIYIESINGMVDKSASDEFVAKLTDSIYMVNKNIEIDNIKTRMFNNKVYVDIEIALDKDMTLYDSHSIAEDVHYTLEKQFNEIKHCMIHVNPKK